MDNKNKATFGGVWARSPKKDNRNNKLPDPAAWLTQRDRPYSPYRRLTTFYWPDRPGPFPQRNMHQSLPTRALPQHVVLANSVTALQCTISGKVKKASKTAFMTKSTHRCSSARGTIFQQRTPKSSSTHQLKLCQKPDFSSLPPRRKWLLLSMLLARSA